ncbi:(2Fe-2S)-binding protein [Pelomonas sp. SE-A7]|uniref:(2Fe-2S)-binding protein n=1 Tax=Pelomonas sp. SE-A7 TaxID=3054953 RepID=UPI00259C8785|nr:(2Fe-2S)-binding protein [Pelomonas sp. SE-A7]MDM4766755.1 (2Fe-2S)-binding protein [Pelomonas sp. SE-A7]
MKLKINQQVHEVEPGISVAAALARVGLPVLRRSASGEPRGPFCGMGVCQECRVTIDGRPGRLSCLTLVAEGMQVETEA